jgi:hypothetical protein
VTSDYEQKFTSSSVLKNAELRRMTHFWKKIHKLNQFRTLKESKWGGLCVGRQLCVHSFLDVGFWFILPLKLNWFVWKETGLNELLFALSTSVTLRFMARKDSYPLNVTKGLHESKSSTSYRKAGRPVKEHRTLSYLLFFDEDK